MVSCSNAKAVLCALVLTGVSLPAGLSYAKVFHSRQEALQLAFPDADRVDKETHVLSADQTAEIEQQSRARVESKLVTIFTAYQGEDVLGYAHIDIQSVRTRAQALMVVLEPDGSVRSVRVLAFHEPVDYLPAERWYSQFVGKRRGDRLRVDGDVHGVVGSTLSTRVAAASIRRVLDYHAVLIAETETKTGGS